MSAERGYRRRKVWINSSFQARYTAVIVGVSLVILAVLGFMYLNTLGEQRRIMGINKAQVGSPVALDDEDAEFNADLNEEVGSDNLERALALILIASVLVAVLAWVSIRMTFRAAGPVYAVSMMLKSLSEGRLGSVRRLRSKDEFKFLQDDVFRLRDSMVEEADTDGDLLARAAEALVSSGKDPGDPLVSELESAAKAKKEKIP